jgi:alpha-glucosidase
MTTSSPARWADSAVVYQVYVRSMADGNGDGIGDLAGISSKLGYLEQLGIDAIWLTPCFPSPQFDHGYDVANYFDIEPAYGNLAEFDTLVATARTHGIKILLDVVPNHCSWDHEWFKAALVAAPGSPERARFYFRDGKGEGGNEPPNNWHAVFGGSAWSRITEPDGTPGQWYLHTFAEQQIDLNWSNADVIDHFDRMLRFWFDRGVEGFRCDAVVPAGKAPGLPDAPPVPEGTRPTDVAGRNPYSMHRPEGHVAWQHWREVVDQYEVEHPGRVLLLVAEAYTPGEPELLLKYANQHEFHQCFAFDLMLAPWIASYYVEALRSNLDALNAAGVAASWTMNNHDAQRSVTRFGRADADQLSSFTQNNLVNSDAPVDLALGTRRARAAAALLLAVPGTIYLYQGEELGIPEVLDIPAEARQDPIFFMTDGAEIGRDGCRVPLPWTSDPASSCGFSPASSTAACWMPQPADWAAYGADSQAADPASMLALYRELTALRRTHNLGSATLHWIVADHPTVLAFEREGVLVAMNTGHDDVLLDTPVTQGRSVIVSSLHNHTDPSRLPANTTLWLA